MKSLILFFALITCFNTTADACSMAAPVIFGVSDQTYVFVGEVVGYGETIESDKFSGAVRAIKVKPLVAINLPDSPKEYFELYKFGVTTYCSPQAEASNHSIGTKLRIVAHKPTLFPAGGSESRIKIESKIFDTVSKINADEGFTTLANSYFDYRNWKPMLAKIRRSKNDEMMGSFSAFIEMEIRKDLLRLQKSKSEKARTKILERLLYSPGIYYERILFPLNTQLLKLNKQTSAKNERPRRTDSRMKLLEKRKKIVESGFFNF